MGIQTAQHPDRQTILLVTNMYLPNFIGGAELIAHYHAKELQLLGYEVVIFAGDPHVQIGRHEMRKEEYDSLTVYRIRLTHEDYSIDYVNYWHWDVERHFETVLLAHRPSVVHFHNIIGLSLGIIHQSKKRRIKTVLTVHDHWGFCLKNTVIKGEGEICRDYTLCVECLPFISDGAARGIPILMRKAYFTLLFQEIDAFISPSRYLAEQYIRSGIGEGRFSVVWNGIDVQRFSSLLDKPRNNIVRFTFVGYFGKHKGLLTLMSALPFLRRKDRIHINLVGAGELLEQCKNTVQELGWSESVTFWGKIPNHEIEDVYRETDVLILPSIWPENQPVSITEAMACAIPAIASALGGTSELIADGVSGYLLERDSARDLADKMMHFVDDPDKASTFGRAAYERIQDKTFKNQVARVLEIYKDTTSPFEEHRNVYVIACAGKRVGTECLAAMDVFARKNENAYFVMSEWLDEDQLREAKLLWIIDGDSDIDVVIPGLKNKIPLLVPESSRKLKKLCGSANCGLYYGDRFEAEACLDYLMNNAETARTLGLNGFSMFSNNGKETVRAE